MADRIRGRLGCKLREARRNAEPLCVDCKAKGIYTPTQVIDHIVPLALGGTDTDDNCRGLCNPCHDRRTAEQFKRRPPRPQTGLDGWALD